VGQGLFEQKRVAKPIADSVFEERRYATPAFPAGGPPNGISLG